MCQLHRRHFLRSATALAAASALGGPAPAFAAALRRPRCGCCMSAASLLTFGAEEKDPNIESIKEHGILSSTGDATTDRFLGRALVRLAGTYHVNPGFGFFYDDAAPQAFALDQTLLPNTWGTVVMGRRRFMNSMRADESGMIVISICAHEFGHIHCYQNGYYKTLAKLDRTARPVELHADFLAGTFLAARKAEFPNLDIQAVGRAFRDLGDTAFDSPSHHGTSEERVAAITAGYNARRGGIENMDELAKAGISYVRGAL